MSNISVSLHWAVQEIVWDKELVSLTGSATVLNFYWHKILIDLWLFQWWDWAELFNRKNIEFINNLDSAFATHSHIDHIWRLPLLYKSWFKKNIYMTKESKYITEKMLIDSLNIQKQEQKIKKKKNKSIISRLEKALKYKNEFIELEWNRKLQTQEIKDFEELNEYLEYFDINDETDIQKINAKLLFDEEDIKWIMWLIKEVEYWSEISLDNQKVYVKNENREDQALLEKLPLELLKKEKDKSNIEKLIHKLENKFNSESKLDNNDANEKLLIVEKIKKSNDNLIKLKENSLDNQEEIEKEENIIKILEDLLISEKKVSSLELNIKLGEKKERKKNNIKLEDVLTFNKNKLVEIKKIDENLLILGKELNKYLWEESIYNLVQKRLESRIIFLKDNYTNYAVNQGSEKRFLREKWIVSLIDEVKESLKTSNLDYKNVNEDLKKELEIAYNFCHNIYPSFTKGNKWTDYSTNDEYNENYKKYKKILDFYWIKKQKHIEILHFINESYVNDILNNSAESLVWKGRESILTDLTKVIKTYWLKLSFYPSDVDKAQKALKTLNKKSDNRNNISVIFSDVAHLVGSASVTMTRNIVKKQIKDILESVSVSFSGDMWRMKDNRLWRPELPPKKLSYLQMESTYAWKQFFYKEKKAIIKSLIDLMKDDSISDRNQLISLMSEIIEWKTKLANDELKIELNNLIDNLDKKDKKEIEEILSKNILNLKNHRNREDSVKELINSIIESKWNVLISVFSQQRAQEILLTILEEKIKNWDDFLDFEILVDWNLTREITNVYTWNNNNKSDLYHLLTYEWQIEAFWKQVFRFLDRDEYLELYTSWLIKTDKSDIDLLSNDLQTRLFWEIKYKYLDENLWKDISTKKDIDRKHIFWILIDKLQENIFWEVLYVKLNDKEWKNISTNEIETNDIFYSRFTDELQKKVFWRVIFTQFDDKKKIILSSSWMIDWWAIMNHLAFILTDEDATLLSPWYLSEWTLWNEIVMKNSKNVTVNWVKYEVLCNKKYIDWFSSHIWHDEILQYIREALNAWLFEKKSTIALSHWNKNSQLELKEDIDQIIAEFNNNLAENDKLKIKVTIPWLDEEYDVLDKEDKWKVKKEKKSKIDNNDKISDLKLPKAKPKIPRLIVEQEKKEDLVEKNEVTQIVSEERVKNIKLIDKIKDRKEELLKKRDKQINDYLEVLLNSSDVKRVNINLSRILNLSSVQKEKFYDDINKKLSNIKSLENHINKLWENKTELDKFILYILDFFKKNKKLLSQDIHDNKINLESALLEKNKLLSDLNNIENTDLKNEVIIIENKLRKINEFLDNIKKITTKIDQLEKDLHILLANELVNSKKVKKINHDLNVLNEDLVTAYNDIYILLWISETQSSHSIEKVKFVKNQLNDELNDFKKSLPDLSEDDKKTIKHLRRKINSKISEIDWINKSINWLKRKILENQNYLKISLKDILPEDANIEYWEIIDDLSVEYNNELEKKLEILFDLVKKQYDLDIKTSIDEINSHISLVYKKWEKSFKWRNLYKELLDTKLTDEIISLKNELSRINRELTKLEKNKNVDNYEEKKLSLESKILSLNSILKSKKDNWIHQFNKKIDLNLEKLDLLMKENVFSKNELNEINNFLSIIRWSDTSKKDKITAKNNLISYIKKWSNNNRNIWKNISFNPKNLEEDILYILSTLFEKEDIIEIDKNFNIYELLKSKVKSIREYVLKNYKKERLKWLDDRLKNINSEIEELDKFLSKLDDIKDVSNNSKDVKKLKDLHSEIELVKSQVENLLK